MCFGVAKTTEENTMQRKTTWLNTFAFTATLLATTFVATPASADGDSLFTVGIGTAVGVNRSTPLFGLPEATFTTELSVKFKLLHVFGFEFSYAPTDSVAEGSQLVFDATFRMSGLLYIVPTYPVSFYLKGGIGAGEFTDLFAYDSPTTSYHGGAGFDIHVHENVVIGAEFLLLAPGIASVRDTIASYANEELARYQARIRNEPVADSGPELAVKDFISVDNFRASVSARYYFS
jgi:hypothetical protein